MVNKNYILWSLISIPILAGIFLIVRQFIGVAGSSGIKNEASFVEKRLSKPPDIVKAVYFTSATGGNAKSIDHLIELANKSELNSVVIDIKDFSGYVAYDSGIEEVKKYKAERLDIKDINGLIKKLHGNNIYVVARLTVFQDPVLAKARPDWAVKNKYTGGTWYDRNGLAWINPVRSSLAEVPEGTRALGASETSYGINPAKDAWDYYVAIAQDAAKRGFDELNFDYIRFPSDGDISALVFPGWDGKKPKADIIGEFYTYLRKKLPDVRLSADMFGFVATHEDDLGIGQLLEKAFPTFDYISPMVYPSHYPPTYLGFANPAEHPYEVVYRSMKGGAERLKKFKSLNSLNKTEFRPWLQDFDLGADYTPAMVRAQIKATQDALGEHYNGFMLWNARNNYSESVLTNTK